MDDNETPAAPESKENRPKWDPATDPDGYTSDDVAPKDFMLDAVLNFVHGMKDEDRGSFGLTVTLGGQVLSGRAISRTEWTEGVAAQYEASNGTKHLREVYDQVNATVTTRHEERRAADLPPRARRFLHMSDVQVDLGGGNFAVLPFWRGALKDVTGWTLGEFKAV